ncbi:hypothetical protein [Bradyrhizobium sacchari]|nr:hypothetical protein [Bradyrhizobium sacchari]
MAGTSHQASGETDVGKATIERMSPVPTQQFAPASLIRNTFEAEKPRSL